MDPLSSQYLLAMTLLSWAAVFSPSEEVLTESQQKLHDPVLNVLYKRIAVENDWVAEKVIEEHSFGLGSLRAWQERCEDCPPSWLMYLAPPASFFAEGIELAEAHIEWLEGQRAVCLWTDEGYWDARLQEARLLLSAYRDMHHVASGVSSISYYCYLRISLRDAMKVFGRDALYSGIYPPAVPFSHFQRIP